MAEPHSAAPISGPWTKSLLQLHKGITRTSKAFGHWAEARGSGKSNQMQPLTRDSHPYLLWGVVLGDQPLEFRGSRELHPLKLLQQAHGHSLRRIGIEEGVGSRQQRERLVSGLTALHSSQPLFWSQLKPKMLPSTLALYFCTAM